jgi:ATP-binding cassette subfamily B protein
MAYNEMNKDEKTQRRTKFEILSRLFSYLKNYKLKVLIITILLLSVMIVNLLNPYILKIAIDEYITDSNLHGLMFMGLIMVLLNIFSMIISRNRINVMGSLTNRITLNIRYDLYSHLQKLSFSFFDERPVGKVLARVMGDVNSLQQFFSSAVTNFIPELLTIIFVVGIMFYMNFQLALVSITVLPLLFFGLSMIEIKSRKRWETYRNKRSNLNAFTHEDFSGIKVVQSFTAEKKQNDNFENYVGETVNSFTKAVKVQDFFGPMIEISYGLGMVLVYLFGFRFIQNGSLTIGTLFAFTWYISMFWRPIMNLSNFYNNLITSLAASERIFEILDTSPNILEKDKAYDMPKILGQVEFRDVHFEYDTGAEVLNGVNFNVTPGESIALVGPTGAGKTTIINLLSRFYDVTSGAVYIDGKNIKDVNLDSMRSQMGIMLQDTFLFSTTIKENMKYGKLNASDEDIIQAAKTVGIHDFIMSLEQGYETKVNERGSRLSVGQRQLLSLARALLADPRILILDEATSNIDTNTERLVQKSIRELLKNRTSFVIAHRLSTIRDVDRIFYIDNGNITEIGSHEELMNKKGSYYNLYISQFKFLKEGA